ncbi:hypothetical protein HO133_010393 [Letharia lupina]|uniref:Rhodopsin domain-containing protein n=1 Tax=Letharia lupina TaxID=560253 RepID=A0A8H6CLA8_9LECA|nr:uncharacterized protein HO133_010393 [Letharia lupina]KAF6225196.1 hypothetical protein HO133_010393 [Letharia lupina]
MSQAGNASQVPIDVNKGVTGALFGLAIIAFIIRSYICIRIHKKVHVEDFILLFAVMSLCAATGLAYATLTAQYALLQLVLHGFEGDIVFRLLGEIPSISKEENAATNLWWLVIFSVKMAFLFFFRRLISRLRSLNVWWWFVTALTIIAGLVSVAASWLTCPYFTIGGLLSCAGTSADHRTIRDTAITTVMDIMSDLLVLSLPVSILWKVRISVRQKIGLAFSLCLSCVMVVVTIVRVAGMRQRGSGSVDIVWLAFWQQQECSIAVLMCSVSAFRSLFVPSPARTPIPRQQRDSPSEKRRRFPHRRPDPDLYDTHETNGLPQIPSAKLAGIATEIRGGRQSEETASLDQRFNSHLPPSEHDHPTEIATTNSSARDAELGLSIESMLPHTCPETSNARQSKSSGTRWWKAFLQPETAPTASTTRTGYWEVISLFRTGHSESIVQSKDRTEGQL